jgi:hypothetical protein
MARAPRQSKRRIHDDFDGAWKNMLSERRFASFVAFFMPDIYDQVDWTRQVEFLEQELRAITRKTKRGHRSVDRLVKVWLNSQTFDERRLRNASPVESSHHPGLVRSRRA